MPASPWFPISLGIDLGVVQHAATLEATGGRLDQVRHLDDGERVHRLEGGVTASRVGQIHPVNMSTWV